MMQIREVTTADTRGYALPLLLLLVVTLVTGCAETPLVMRYDDYAGRPDLERPRWPSAPNMPRYAYEGRLTGEDNFVPEDGGRKGAMASAFAWLAGLSEHIEAPLSLQRPQGGVTGDDGRVYVCDVNRAAVFVFDEAAGKLLLWKRATADMPFLSPIAAILDGNGDLLVSDSELGMVVRLNPQGEPVGTLGKGVLMRPTGMVRNPATGFIYVSDTRDNNIKVFDGDGLLVQEIGNAGNDREGLNSPTYLAFAQNELYVTDTLNARIQVFDTEGNWRRNIGSRGLYVGNLVRPKGIAVDDEGNLYIIESFFDHLLVYDREGNFLLSLGGPGRQPGEFNLPTGLWIDKQNRVYIADMLNGRVEIFKFLGGMY